MKIKYIFIVSLCSLLVFACKENTYDGFETKGSVYFQGNTTDWNILDSVITYSFVGRAQIKDTIWLQVNLLGDASPIDRKFKIVEDPLTSNAIVGRHYEALNDEYIMKANEMKTSVPIVIHRTEELEKQSVMLSLVLQPTSDLDLGYSNRLRMSIILSDFLVEPIWWNTPYDPYVGTMWEGMFAYKAADYYGPYSRRKHELCVQELGQDFPESIFTFINDDYWVAAMAHMSEYFSDNYPIMDENGNAIEPW